MDNVNVVATWRKGAEKFYNADPQKIAEEVQALGDNPKTEEILDMARGENTEFHKVIEWNDDVAAEKYRLEQVRHVMQDLHITYVGMNEKKKKEKVTVPLRMFYHLKDEEGYRPIHVIMKDQDLHEKLLMTAYSELKAFTVKYSNLQELDQVFEAIREFGKKLVS